MSTLVEAGLRRILGEGSPSASDRAELYRVMEEE